MPRAKQDSTKTENNAKILRASFSADVCDLWVNWKVYGWCRARCGIVKLPLWSISSTCHLWLSDMAVCPLVNILFFHVTPPGNEGLRTQSACDWWHAEGYHVTVSSCFPLFTLQDCLMTKHLCLCGLFLHKILKIIFYDCVGLKMNILMLK